MPQHSPYRTALENTCALETPSALLNAAFRYAKDNIARCMRWYTLGWGMSNAPQNYAIVVGRDTGWMCLGADYVAPWFAPEALKVFRDRQKPNGQILEYVDLETGETSDYGLNIADNTPLYLWGMDHHWRQHRDTRFRAAFLASVERAADYLAAAIGTTGLVAGIPVGTSSHGTMSWRNIIPGYVLAGEVTELNALASMALRCAAHFTGDSGYAAASDRIAAAIEAELWSGDCYLLTRFEGSPNVQVTGDAVFPALCGVASEERARRVLDRLWQEDFWSERGMRTVPTSDAEYAPGGHYGLLGGSWPNLTLWYAAAAAPYYPDRALTALEIVATPVVDTEENAINVRHTEFPEFFHGDSGVQLGMQLSPWVAPTFVWAVMEGLLGLRWDDGRPLFEPHWPECWERVTLRNLPTPEGPRDFELLRG